jgi:hypothetical protein
MVKISEATNIDSIQLQEQASAPATPASGFMALYADNAGNAHVKNDAGIAKQISGATLSSADVTNPPTDAELDSAFGTPAAVGGNFVGILDDNGADTNVYFVFSNGTSWWYIAGTKAT